ncbi:MAG TPA: hypothetical protein PL183_13470 [Aquamicrobium sp.]|nr:hypothetical protein [Aquamicrobium sp.]
MSLSNDTITAAAIPPALLRAFETRISLPLKDTAALLGMDAQTLRGHVEAGNIRCVVKGLGRVRLRREFRLADILEFLETMSRRACPSTGPRTRRSTTTTSDGVVVGFMARRERPNGGGPKR